MKGKPVHNMCPFEAIADASMKSHTFRLYALLCAYRRNKPSDELHGWAFPSQKTLAEDLGISTRQVRENLKKLQEAGWVDIYPRIKIHPDFSGHRSAKCYYVHWVKREPLVESDRNCGSSLGGAGLPVEEEQDFRLTQKVTKK
jgi:hypothetical protein